MKVKWLGHAAFLITSEEGTRIITDPYTRGMGINYGEITETADVVLVSHDHGDHNNVAAVRGNPQVIKGPGSHTARGIEFKGVAAYHDDTKGSQRGPDTIFCFTLEGLRICHLGDLGDSLTQGQVQEIGLVDVLFIPVGGFYTIDARVATQVMEALKAKVAIPMHFKTDKCGYPIGGVEDFLKGKSNIKKLNQSEVEFKKEALPETPEIVVLQHAL